MTMFSPKYTFAMLFNQFNRQKCVSTSFLSKAFLVFRVAFESHFITKQENIVYGTDVWVFWVKYS